MLSDTLPPQKLYEVENNLESCDLEFEGLLFHFFTALFVPKIVSINAPGGVQRQKS